MRKQTKLVAVLSAAALLAIGASMTSFAAAKGWTEENGEWVWLDSDGERVYNEWKKSGDNYYWLNDDGVMATNTLVDDDEENIYYVNEYGARVKNTWVSLENEDDDVVNNADSDAEIPETLWYYFGSNGKAYRCTDGKDWVKKTVDYAGGSGYFFFNSEGQMGSGWIEHPDADGTVKTYYCGTENEGWAYTYWQYLEPNSDMQSGDYDDEEWFYFGSKGGNGKMSQNKTQYIEGRYYTFNEDGVLENDWYSDTIATSAIASAPTVYAYANESGALGTGWVYTDKYNDEDETKWYYLVTIDIDGVRRSVPFNSLVDAETETPGYRAKSIKSKTYLFDKTGVMVADLKDLNRGVDDTGVYGGTVDYDGTNANKADVWNGVPTKVLAPGLYYFKEGGYTSTAGQMQTGRVTYEDDGDYYYYYFDKDGRAITDEVKDGIVYGHDGARIQAEDGNANEVVEVEDYAIKYSKGTLEVNDVNYIPVGSRIIVSSTGKLRTSGKVTIEGIRYTIKNGVIDETATEIVD